jgi:hypothetical protein
MNEDWDDMAAPGPHAGEELERLLARYARVRLEPSPAQARRARAAVIEVAWRRRVAPAAAAARRGPFAGWGFRRLAVSLSAAVLAGLMLGTSVFASSRAGGPLYEARLAIESLALPTEMAARIDAHIAGAQARLAEAVEAAGRQDGPAIHAALAAYDRVIGELLAADGEAATRALEAVRFHREVLLQVAARVPDAAGAGIATALANSDRVIDQLTARGAGKPATNPGNGDPAGGPGARPGGPGGPGATERPKPTQKPKPTPKPAATERPDATDKPSRSRPPRSTPDPGGKG